MARRQDQERLFSAAREAIGLEDLFLLTGHGGARNPDLSSGRQQSDQGLQIGQALSCGSIVFEVFP